MADFKSLKIQPSDAGADAEMVVKLSHIELEQKRLRVTERATNAMLVTAALSTMMLVVLAVILAVSLQQLRVSMDAIADSVGPTAVGAPTATPHNTRAEGLCTRAGGEHGR